VWFLYISSICSYADNFFYLFVKNIPENKNKKDGLERNVDIITNIVVHVIAIH